MADGRWLWDSRSLTVQLLREALVPFAAVFRAGVAMRNALYDRGWFAARDLGAPSVSVGNLTVGGTGKTPVANWIARELQSAGARPAILLRGYGEDETLVHERLAPNAIVVADADRVRGARVALARGADVLVLDDAFQHRRVRRDIDIVLVSADAAHQPDWALPVGPWREPLSALRRARLAVVTRKSAESGAAALMGNRIALAAGPVPIAIVRLEGRELHPWGRDDAVPLSTAKGESVLAVSAIGDPLAFEAQLAEAGFEVIPARYADHHRYTPSDVASLLQRSPGVKRVICTLKDAVKLGPLWPPDGPRLWYLSQRVTIERGAELITGLLAELLEARPKNPTRPGARPTN